MERFFSRIIRHIGRGIGRWVSRTCFGTWRRSLATLVVAGLVSARYYPDQVWPILAPLFQIAIMFFGIRVMLIPFWPLRQ